MFHTTYNSNIFCKIPGHIFFPTDAHWSPILQEYRDWVAAGNVATPLPVADADRIAGIKGAAARVITERYPDWDQINKLTRRVELLEKGTLTGDETAELQTLKDAATWIKDVRTASGVAEAQGVPVDQVVWPVKV